MAFEMVAPVSHCDSAAHPAEQLNCTERYRTERYRTEQSSTAWCSADNQHAGHRRKSWLQRIWATRPRKRGYRNFDLSHTGSSVL